MDTDKLNKKLAEWRWGKDKVEKRYGFWDDGGYFCEMQSNPYGQQGQHHEREFCFLSERRDLTTKELETYTKDYNTGQASFIPEKADFWEIVPDFTDPEFGIAYCFKWLVPESSIDDIRFILFASSWGALSCIIEAKGKKYQSWAGDPRDKITPELVARAFCLAFEQLAKESK